MAKIGMMSFAHPHAYSYAACLKELATADFVSIWDDDAKRGRAAAKESGVKFVSNLDKFLASDIEGVVICSENVKHRPMVEAAAKAGKWILCEKPLSPKVADAKAMIKACKDAGVGLGTAFPCRYVPALITAKEQLDAGEYGDILAASCTNHGQWPGAWDWFSDTKRSGGGATMDHTVHVADLLRWMLNKEFKKVYCELGNQLHKGVFKTDDLGSLHLEMDGGVQISHLASWSRPDSFPTWGDVTFEIIGTGGVLTVHAFNQKLDVYSDKAGKTEWAPYGANPDMGLIKDFVASVDERREPTISGIDGLRAVEVTVAAYKSAKEKKVMKI